tara:strand:+ start:589 stop:1212 length:624 start_codon:yes stop_codon:yes gene_type:complete
MFVEKWDPVNNDWKKIGKVFFDNYLASMFMEEMEETFGMDEKEVWEIMVKYRDNKPPSNRTEQYIINKYLPSRMAEPSLGWFEAKDMGLLPYPFSESPYGGRCYRLFGILAGVRDTSQPMIGGIDYPKGAPTDMSPEVYEIVDEYGVDGHSHNYYTVGELLDSPYAKMNTEELRDIGIDPYFFNNALPDLLKLGDKDNIRIVFFFDN